MSHICPNFLNPIFLQPYPFDIHECSFGLRPLIDTDVQLNLINLSFDEDVALGVFTADFEKHSDTSIIVEDTKFSFIGYNIDLKRIPTSYIISHYIPVTLYTWASFSSFDLRHGTNNDRIGFLVTLFLVLANMMISQTNSSPGGNIVTSIGKSFSAFLLVFLKFPSP